MKRIDLDGKGGGRGTPFLYLICLLFLPGLRLLLASQYGT
jgi:hypothetical protein